jgi:hypothetical protein
MRSQKAPVIQTEGALFFCCKKCTTFGMAWHGVMGFGPFFKICRKVRKSQLESMDPVRSDEFVKKSPKM